MLNVKHSLATNTKEEKIRSEVHRGPKSNNFITIWGAVIYLYTNLYHAIYIIYIYNISTILNNQCNILMGESWQKVFIIPNLNKYKFMCVLPHIY